jgi:hypothetical protein
MNPYRIEKAIITLAAIIATLFLFLTGVQVGIHRGRALQERETSAAEYRAATFETALNECRKDGPKMDRKERRK